MEEKKSSLDQIYTLLENQERTIYFDYHKDVKAREKAIKDAINKITALKMLGEDLSDELILLGDMVSLEITYSPSEIDIVTQKLVISAETLGELSLYSIIGSSVFAQKVGDVVPATLPSGEVATIRILGKNKDIFEGKEEEPTLSK